MGLGVFVAKPYRIMPGNACCFAATASRGGLEKRSEKTVPCCDLHSSEPARFCCPPGHRRAAACEKLRALFLLSPLPAFDIREQQLRFRAGSRVWHATCFQTCRFVALAASQIGHRVGTERHEVNPFPLIKKTVPPQIITPPKFLLLGGRF